LMKKWEKILTFSKKFSKRYWQNPKGLL
jgi:hypothetical protein